MLENDAAIGARRRDLFAVDEDRACFHRQEAADQVKQCRLAAAGRPKEGDKLAIGNLQGDLVECKDLAPACGAIHVIHAVDDDLRGCGHDGCKRP